MPPTQNERNGHAAVSDALPTGTGRGTIHHAGCAPANLPHPLPQSATQAAVNGHATVVEMVLAAGADRGAVNNDGRTAGAMAKTDALKELLTQP